jgi:hypothetical protein
MKLISSGPANAVTWVFSPGRRRCAATEAAV